MACNWKQEDIGCHYVSHRVARDAGNNLAIEALDVTMSQQKSRRVNVHCLAVPLSGDRYSGVVPIGEHVQLEGALFNCVASAQGAKEAVVSSSK